jgi:hypothetical protein
MKKSLFIIFFALAALPAMAQLKPEVWEVIDSLPRSQVPKIVQQAFKLRYPGIRALFWFQLNDDYEAQFLIHERSTSVEFSKTGRWINTETVLQEEDFPVQVLDYVRLHYPDYELDTVIEEDSPVGKFYDVTIIYEDLDQELVFDQRGYFLRKAEAPE